MDLQKWISAGIRIQGLIFIYDFLESSVSLTNLLTGFSQLRQNSTQAFVLHGLLSLFLGIYLAFTPEKVLALLLKDPLPIDESPAGEYARLLTVGLKLFGIYLGYRGLTYLVTTFNVMAGYFVPGKVEAEGYLIQAVFHLLIASGLIFQTGTLLRIMLP